MPYIPKSQRIHMDKGDIPYSTGQLNYKITRICLDYLKLNEKPNYYVYNDIIGALECAKQEFYRRYVVPYENKKIKENGDIEI